MICYIDDAALERLAAIVMPFLVSAEAEAAIRPKLRIWAEERALKPADAQSRLSYDCGIPGCRHWDIPHTHTKVEL